MNLSLLGRTKSVIAFSIMIVAVIMTFSSIEKSSVTGLFNNAESMTEVTTLACRFPNCINDESTPVLNERSMLIQAKKS